MPKITKKLVDEVLLRGSELVSKKNGWMQGDFCNNETNLKKANCFCALGAAAKASVEVAQGLGMEFVGKVDVNVVADGGSYRSYGESTEKSLDFAHDLFRATSERLEAAVPTEETYLDGWGNENFYYGDVPTYNDAKVRTQDDITTLFLNALSK